MVSAREALAKLRSQVRPRDVEALEAEAREEERVESYVAGLRAERQGAELDLARLRAMRPDSRVARAGDRLDRQPPTAAERVVAAERRLADIDAEVVRVEGQ